MAHVAKAKAFIAAAQGGTERVCTKMHFWKTEILVC